VYLALNLTGSRFRLKFLPLSAAALWTDLRAALRGRLSHSDPRHYNALQRVAYLTIVVVLAVMLLSGLALWKSVQLSLLANAMGGYEAVRRIHFWAMAAIVAFVLGHVAMVALVPRSLLTMIRGR
jgi:thiosulfate reductase cytochrome b subunit